MKFLWICFLFFLVVAWGLISLCFIFFWQHSAYSRKVICGISLQFKIKMPSSKEDFVCFFQVSRKSPNPILFLRYWICGLHFVCFWYFVFCFSYSSSTDLNCANISQGTPAPSLPRQLPCSSLRVGEIFCWYTLSLRVSSFLETQLEVRTVFYWTGVGFFLWLFAWHYGALEMGIQDLQVPLGYMWLWCCFYLSCVSHFP